MSTDLVWWAQVGDKRPLPGPTYAREALLDAFGASEYPIVLRPADLIAGLAAVRASVKMPEFVPLWDELFVAIANHHRITLERI